MHKSAELHYIKLGSCTIISAANISKSMHVSQTKLRLLINCSRKSVQYVGMFDIETADNTITI